MDEKDGYLALLDFGDYFEDKLFRTLQYLSETDGYSFTATLATRSHSSHGRDPRSVQAVVMLKRWLNGSATLADLQAAAADGWAAYRDNYGVDDERANVAFVCAAAASLERFQTAYFFARMDGPSERANQVANLKTLVNGGSLP